MRFLMAFFLVLASGVSLASARIVHHWESVRIESGRLAIEARLTSSGEFLEELRIQAGIRSVSVPKQELEKFPAVRLNTIEIEWNCSDATAPFESQAFVDQCEQLVSIRYDDSEHGIPDLEYWPVVTFVFSNGQFLGARLTTFVLPAKP